MSYLAIAYMTVGCLIVMYNYRTESPADDFPFVWVWAWPVLLITVLLWEYSDRIPTGDVWMFKAQDWAMDGISMLEQAREEAAR